MIVAHDLLTTREVAKLLGVGTTSVKRWADSGLLSCVKTPGGHRRFPRAAVDAFMADSLHSGGDDGAPRVDRADAWVGRLINGITPDGVARELQSELRERGSWSELADSMQPIIEELGHAWARGDITVIQEHIASERLARGLVRCSEGIELPPRAPTCMLMTAENEEHTLGLSLLELCLRDAGWSAIWSGRKTPVHVACDFIASNPVDMVAVSASQHARDTASLADQAERLAQACQKRDVPLVLGGAGLWPEKPRYGYRLHTFGELRELLRMITPTIIPALDQGSRGPG